MTARTIIGADPAATETSPQIHIAEEIR
ncbi:cupin, partial [Methylobacterium radiotolerans]